MKVKQFLHANQFHLYDDKNDLLQSYNSLVVSIHHYVDIDDKGNEIEGSRVDMITLGKDWDYSRTTLAHVYQFLEKYSDIIIPYNVNKKQYIQKLIDDNVIDYNEDMK